MIGEIILAIFLGILAGTFTGLTPGIHTNLIAIALVGVSSYLLNIIQPMTLVAFIIAMGITHTFLNAIPSIFLGAPETGTILLVLPGHRLLLQGQGYLAVKLTIIGSLFGLVLSVALIPLLAPLIVLFAPYLQKYLVYLIILIVIIMILREKKKVLALFVFLLSGVLGLLVLMSDIKQPLFPLLSGLFGISTLIISLKDKVKIPRQFISKKLGLTKAKLSLSVITSTFSGGCVALLPGVGSSEAAILGNELTGKKLGDKGFLTLVGGVDTVNMVFSLLAFYALNKPRNGAIVAVQQIISQISFNQLIFFLSIALLVGGISTFLTLFLTKRFSSLISKINYQKLCFSVMLFVSLLVFVFSGPFGFLVMIISTAIGLLPPLLGIRRGLNMGILLLPVVLFLL